MILGYKAFNPDGTTRYGDVLEVGKNYEVSGKIHTRFGSKSNNGFHYCEDIGAVFRFFDLGEGIEPKIARIYASGDIDRAEDYTGDYETFACRSIFIDKWLTHDEIVDTVLDSLFSIRLALPFNSFVLLGDDKYKLLDRVRENRVLLEDTLYYKFGYKDYYRLSYEEKEEIVKRELQTLDEKKGKAKTILMKND